MTRGTISLLLALWATSTFLATTVPAGAISRISATTHTCGELRSIISRERAVIVTHPGTRSSGTLYDRYVSDSAYCSAGYVATDDWVPAKDRDCRLSNCQIFESPFD